MRKAVRNFLKKQIANFAQPSELPDIFIFSTPRSGSTWLMELIQTQSDIKIQNEPFNIRHGEKRYELGIDSWDELYSGESEEKIRSYVDRMITAELYFGSLKDFNPFSAGSSKFKYRFVFKIVNAGKDRMEWFYRNYDCKIVYLIRHPIPVSISRKQTPRLSTFINGPFKRHFSELQLNRAEFILNNGSQLQRNVLSWCMQNMLPLNNLCEDCLMVTYEQLVLDPEPVINKMAAVLELQQPEKMKERISIPSRTTYQSDIQTRDYFGSDSSEGDRDWLVKKWKKQINNEEEKELMDILKVFGITAYREGSFVPDSSIWIK